MPTTAIYAGRILTPLEEISEGVILVEDGRIAAIGHRDEIRVPSGAADYSAAGLTVVPGFVDVHIHGAGGHDVMEANARALDCIASTVARYGTTSLVATTTFAAIADAISSIEPGISGASVRILTSPSLALRNLSKTSTEGPAIASRGCTPRRAGLMNGPSRCTPRISAAGGPFSCGVS